ncbi:uncharacterized protein VTP21DRAFT_2690 [Calcarisporiella thermophila]|uniref:uncharacterized protein n=1 Tax=Calcarisporiella thermophila TaxID=911321 RepID=UPI0037448055
MTHFSFIFFLLLTWCIHVHGGWFFNEKRLAGHDSWNLNLLTAGPEERAALQDGMAALEAYVSGPNSCFRRAAMGLEKGCKSEDMSELQKAKCRYAMRLTICEMATAGIAKPGECEKEDQSGLNRCIKFLSKVPQHWTSYSAYFRQVVSMCFAVRYEIEREIIAELHRNITRLQLNNYDVLEKQQARAVQHFKQETSWFEFITERQNELEKMIKHSWIKSGEIIEDLHFAHTKFQELIQGLNHRVEMLESKLDNVSRTIFDSFETLSSTAHALHHQLDAGVERVRGIQDTLDESTRFAKTLSTELHASLSSLSLVIESVATLKKQAILAMDDILTSQMKAQAELDNGFRSHIERLSHLHQQMVGLQEAMEDLKADVLSARNIVSVSIEKYESLWTVMIKTINFLITNGTVIVYFILWWIISTPFRGWLVQIGGRFQFSESFFFFPGLTSTLCCYSSRMGSSCSISFTPSEFDQVEFKRTLRDLYLSLSSHSGVYPDPKGFVG